MWLKLFLKLLNFLVDSVLIFYQFLIFQASGIFFPFSLRKQPADGDATSGFLARLRNERRNSILMTYHYPNLLGRAAWEIWFHQSEAPSILGDPGADKGGEGKSKRLEKYIWNEEK